MYKAAAIGNYDSIYGFASVGMDIFPAENKTECINAVRQALSGDYGAVFITENYAGVVSELITGPLPAVMFIPSSENSGSDRSQSYAVRELHSMVEKAAGADIL